MADGKKIRAKTGEDDLIEMMKTLLGDSARRIPLGIGDDCAIIGRGPQDTDILITTDMLVEGTHFKLEWASPYQIGWKSMAASVSDIAAMGGRPTSAVVSIGVRARGRDYFIKSFYEGIRAASDTYGVAIAGGDTVRSDVVAVSIAMLGEVAHGKAVTRKGARPGDTIFVTGTCGDSLAGLDILNFFSGKQGKRPLPYQKQLTERHLKPEPSIKAGLAAAASGAVTAMMDLSDGIAADLPRLCKRSLVGAKVNSYNIPVSNDLITWCDETGRTASEYALLGGEDFNLLIAADPKKTNCLLELIEELGMNITAIGEITSRKQGLALLSADGSPLPWPDTGFQHF
jgi:thiamine-monophosphate kinase